MRKLGIVLVSFTLLFQMAVPSQAAVTPTASPSGFLSPTKSISSADEKLIQSFKDKIATTVAQLRKKNLKAIAGSITSIDKNSINIKTSDDVAYTVKIDENLTKFYLIVGAS